MADAILTISISDNTMPHVELCGQRRFDCGLLRLVACGEGRDARFRCYVRARTSELPTSGGLVLRGWAWSR